MGDELQEALRDLRVSRDQARAEVTDDGANAFPAGDRLAEAIRLLSAGLFPRRLGRFSGTDHEEDQFVASSIGNALAIFEGEVAAEIKYWEEEAKNAFDPGQAATIVRLFIPELPRIRELIQSDIEAAFLGDPAARTVDEILLCYPGALALLHHRIAHPLFNLGAPITARIISEQANARTGIDIHPGATVGSSCFIDHGTGVVVGETAIVGSNVRIYQHVTLGARAPLGVANLGPRERYARHPIVEDDVTVYAGATILGRVTVGQGSTIGANVWIEQDVPPRSFVRQAQPTIFAGVDNVLRDERIFA